MDARLGSETDITGFREEAGLLLAQQVPPEAVHWHIASNGAQSVEAAVLADQRPRVMPRAVSAIVPTSFLRLCEIVVLHHDPERFSLLYRLLWRLVHEPELRNDSLDPDMLRANQLGQAVRRDMHKMKAFLRFRPVHDGHADPLDLAWFEPAHHIAEAVAPWFMKRFPQGRWAILTPVRSVAWDTCRLHFAPGLPRSQAFALDDSDAAWLARYRAVFGMRLEATTQGNGAIQP